MNRPEEANRDGIQVWVVCEGKHEQHGALPNLIKRLRLDSESWQLIFEPWKNPRGGRRRFRKTGKGDGVFKKFVASLIDAETLGYDAVICLVDQDQVAERQHSVAMAQESDVSHLPRAFGVAVEMFDAWFLADEKALSSVCQTTVDKQRAPEKARSPKDLIESICKGTEFESGVAEFYAQISDCIDLEVLRKRCPQGFNTWADRLMRMEVPDG